MKVKIKGKIWTIEFVKEVDDYDSLGSTNGINRLIKIKRGQDDDVLKDTVAHELTHAYLFECGRYMSTAEEENIAHFVGRNYEDLSHNFDEIVGYYLFRLK